MTGKKCSKCGKIKRISKFYKDKSKKSGYHSCCKECDKAYNRKYNKTSAAKKRSKRYNKTEKGKQSRRVRRSKTKAKRKKWGEPIPINKWFKGSNLHHLHIDKEHKTCIYMPIRLHQPIVHAYNKKKTMNKINNIAFEWLATQEII